MEYNVGDDQHPGLRYSLMPSALSKLCKRRLGLEIDQLSEAEFRAHLPDIVKALNAEAFATARLVSKQVAEVQKAALLEAYQRQSFIPFGTLVRDERLGESSPEQSTDPNNILNDIFPR